MLAVGISFCGKLQARTDLKLTVAAAAIYSCGTIPSTSPSSTREAPEQAAGDRRVAARLAVGAHHPPHQGLSKMCAVKDTGSSF